MAFSSFWPPSGLNGEGSGFQSAGWIRFSSYLRIHHLCTIKILVWTWIFPGLIFSLDFWMQKGPSERPWLNGGIDRCYKGLFMGFCWFWVDLLIVFYFWFCCVFGALCGFHQCSCWANVVKTYVSLWFFRKSFQVILIAVATPLIDLVYARVITFFPHRLSWETGSSRSSAQC